MKKILFISGITIPDTPTGIRHHQIANYLSAHYDIEVISIDQPNLDTIRNELNNQHLYKKIIKTILKKLKKLIITYEYSIYRRRLVKISLKALKENNSDLVILGILPFSMYPIARALKKIYKDNIKILIDISDPFYFNALSYKRSKFKNRLIFYYEKYYQRFADGLVVLNDEIADNYSDLLGYTKPIYVVEQGYSGDLISERLFMVGEKKENTHCFSLIYAGNFYKDLRDPATLFKSIEKYEKDIILNIYGGALNGGLKLDHFDTKKIKFFSYLEQELLIHEYHKADIIVFLDNQFGVQVPAKTIEIMLFSKPILFISNNITSPSFKYLKNYSGLVAVKNDLKDIKHGLDLATGMIGGSYYNPFVSKYLWENLMIKYRNIIETFLDD